MKAAGILFLTLDNRALFLQRAAGGSYPGLWCYPGGKQEEGETAEQCAVREAKEECGPIPDGVPRLWVRQIAPPAPAANGLAEPNAEEVDFTTFVQRVKEPFEVELSSESTAYVWAPVDQPPAPLLPGCNLALDRLSMDEMGVAKAIRDGRLTSPQRYDNMSLFAIRITGTGVAYRKSLKEYVWRDPNIYLNSDFLERCNGLPVIFEHPKNATLNSKEFADRVIGSVVLPYLKGNEVWAIAKIYDDSAIQMMMDEQLSTSPAVVFRDPSVNMKMELESGEKLLIEGKPSLLDHIAICKQGVWDKGGEPAGVSTTGEAMTDEEKKAAEAKAKADAEAQAKADAEAGGDKLDKLLKGIDSLGKRFDDYDAKMDSLHKRMDAVEGDDPDKDKPKEVAADKKKDEASEKEEMAERMKKENERKDAEEAEKKMAADKARKDAEESETARKIRDIESRLPLQMNDADYRARADVQAKADAVFQAFGDAAPRPLDGETVSAYRRRMSNKLKEHSARWSKVELSAFADDNAFTVVEEQIYADAMDAALNPKDLPEGQLRSVVRRDTTGRQITSFYGEPIAWMRDFGSNRRRLAGIRNRDYH